MLYLCKSFNLDYALPTPIWSLSFRHRLVLDRRSFVASCWAWDLKESVIYQTEPMMQCLWEAYPYFHFFFGFRNFWPSSSHIFYLSRFYLFSVFNTFHDHFNRMNFCLTTSRLKTRFYPVRSILVCSTLDFSKSF